MVVVGSSEDKIGGEGEMVDPMRVRSEGTYQCAFCGVPKLDGFVMGGCIDCASTTPSDAGDGRFMTGKDQVYPL